MNLRNLEQIQEYDQEGRGLPWGTLLLAAAAGGALVVVLMTTLERQAPPAASTVDPLQQLVAEARKNPAAPAGVVKDEQVTFPQLLSDQGAPTTAMVAVKDDRGRLLKREPGATALASHEGLPHLVMPASSGTPDRVPLPAGDLLNSTPVTQKPSDELSQLAKSGVEITDAALAPMGAEGGYEIQVASFRQIKDADAFVEELRKRDHRAYRQAAYVAGRGLWHRVRIGPFKAKYQAVNYQTKLEAAERISTFLVDPAKVKRQREIRDAKADARARKKKRRQARAAAAAAAKK